MDFIIDPDTGKTVFELDQVELVTDVEEVAPGKFSFRVLLKDGSLKTMTFSSQHEAYKVHRLVRDTLFG